MPRKIPRFVAMAAGQSSGAKMQLVEHLLFDMCKIIDERGYSFEDNRNVIRDFIIKDGEAPDIMEELLRHLLGVVWADDLVPHNKPFDLSRN